MHEEVSTRSEHAQTYYDQGVTFLYAYNYIDAIRSFQGALRSDPKLAMAHLGLSFAFEDMLENAAARTEERRAEALASYVTNREKTRIAFAKPTTWGIAARQPKQ
ncbi:MAG TPA: hypothetical protein VFW31_09850 [Candidatus Angelobacter sp.]|nr:hypothetical protein [Candidatus Angelobacter sp.]